MPDVVELVLKWLLSALIIALIDYNGIVSEFVVFVILMAMPCF